MGRLSPYLIERAHIHASCAPFSDCSYKPEFHGPYTRKVGETPRKSRKDRKTCSSSPPRRGLAARLGRRRYSKVRTCISRRCRFAYGRFGLDLGWRLWVADPAFRTVL